LRYSEVLFEDAKVMDAIRMSATGA